MKGYVPKSLENITFWHHKEEFVCFSLLLRKRLEDFSHVLRADMF